MWTATPRRRARRRAVRTGGEVRLGVWRWMESWAWEKRCSRNVLRGVGGAWVWEGEAKGRKRGLRWCGEGRNMAGMDVVGARGVMWWAGRGVLEENSCGGSDAGVEAVVGMLGTPGPSLAQNSSQNRMNCWTIGPESSTQPSSQASQLTLQPGRKTFLRSIMINLGCMTLKGSRNMLLISRSSPWSSEGKGSPSFLAHMSRG